jgi:tetratricopeptide (TPR) repeat protein
MRPIGFSSGALALSDFRLALELLADKAVEAVELSALREGELPVLIEALGSLNLRRYRHISLHAPSHYKPENEAAIASLLASVPKDWLIVLHPDAIFDFDVWEPFGGRLCIENMDRRKAVGQTPGQLQAIFGRLPEAGFCFDIGHARQCDTTMTMASLILAEFRSRLKIVHVSDVSSSSHHDPLSDGAILAFRSVASQIPESVPIIIEGRVKHEAIELEIGRVREALPLTAEPAIELRPALRVQPVLKEAHWDDLVRERTELLERARFASDTSLVIQRLDSLGEALLRSGDARAALECLEEGLQLVRQLGDKHLEAPLLVDLALVKKSLGKLEEALPLEQEALEIARTIGDRRAETIALGNIGGTVQSMGNLTTALKYHEMSLRAAVGLGDALLEGKASLSIGVAYLNMGNLPRALQAIEVALQKFRQTGKREEEAEALGFLGEIYRERGSLTEALRLHEAALDLHRAVRDRAQESSQLGKIGRILHARGELRKAVPLLKTAISISREINYPQGEAERLTELGNVVAQLGEFGAAQDAYTRALKISVDLGQLHGQAAGLGNIGMLNGMQGNFHDALIHLDKALRLFQLLGDTVNEAVTLLNMGLTELSRADRDAASSYFERAKSVAARTRHAALFEKISAKIDAASGQQPALRV